ncbi:hypothetical protein CAPTEDRAFT_112865 [Capitella teleta]|uniref:BRISC and BRCA1-A complex member 2 n=1 Tax=Capitella teleta TaxID=283909 RepID=R7V964_CAPTE|nr:hypothetical protein CAPTEDRAFT_112865 [Capitella teleta]|eukprot:ELU12901.1 hypothetical protein CAPTEDRAFT_112865 [Capitella teleta]
MTAEEELTLAKFSPGIVKYVEALMREGRVGICSGALRVHDIHTGCTSMVVGPCADRFKVAIPFAGHSVDWEIIFNNSFPHDPPDFIFGSDERNFFPNVDNLKHLVDWDPSDPNALLLVLQDLLSEYKTLQHSLIDQHSRLQFEYSSLVEGGFRKEDIEVHVSRRGENKYGPVNFLIKLNVDFSGIPAYLTKDNPGEDSAVLLVSFPNPEGGKGSPQLFLSPRVERALGGAMNLRIPGFPNGACLIDYVPNVQELLTNKVNQIVQSYDKRREYMSAFLSHFGGSLIEQDSEGFSSISFLFEWHDFFYVLTVNLSLVFPQEQPIFVFSSVYHENSLREPFHKEVRDYPYSPRWSAQEMASRARAFILDHIGSFQISSVREGLFK